MPQSYKEWSRDEFYAFMMLYAADSDDIENRWFEGVDVVGITSGASAPESLVQEVIAYLQNNFSADVVEGLDRKAEDVKFPMPKIFKNSMKEN